MVCWSWGLITSCVSTADKDICRSNYHFRFNQHRCSIESGDDLVSSINLKIISFENKPKYFSGNEVAYVIMGFMKCVRHALPVITLRDSEHITI